MSKVRRIYVEKKQPYAVRAKELKEEIESYLGIAGVTGVRVLIRYDIQNLSEETYRKALGTVFFEPPVDLVYEEEFFFDKNAKIFSVEFLPGQFDQRADSAKQCVQFLKEDEEPIIRSAVTYVIEGSISEEDFKSIKEFCINPVDSRETGLTKPQTLESEFEEPKDVIIFHGFGEMSDDELKKLYESLNLAMTFKDFIHIRNYFKAEEHRDPTMTEIRVLDTYWSDHCRHTTFSTELKNIEFEEGYYQEPILSTYKQYLDHRKEVSGGREDRFVCLMDLALTAMRKLKKEGKLKDLEESEEINACNIVVPVEINGIVEEWIVSFKNETHNHPTEIEPFGGAATCLGGAIRDPLSGRTYVYQAMRVTGAADPRASSKETLKGKLPQRKIVTGAARGYSSYGNQIGLATGLVKEIYHPNYAAKRMEIGAVIGAAPRKNVVRKSSEPGDQIILLGGRTGRDGCGGATGSSKVHTEESTSTCTAEVQKGNPLTERKIQRLFRREEVTRLIKKCNDFGAGGVSVAIGELADGLRIFLDKVPKKYAGLDGTEIAISESQERMAVVVATEDVEQFFSYAKEENLEAALAAVVTEEKRLVMEWRGKEIVNISRSFLDTNGAHQETDVVVTLPKEEDNYFMAKTQEIKDVKEKWLELLKDLNVCSKKGLAEMFDSSIGAGSVFMPYGGKYQMTENQTMAAKLPVLEGKTNVATMMSYGFDPYLSSWSPYHGAVYAVIESVAKIVSSGGDYRKIRFTFQEYFKRMTDDMAGWGEPFSALLGAYSAQIGLGLPSIGGKDSMSGTFQDIDVPPTLVSFAVNTENYHNMITPELKQPGNKIIKISIEKDQYHLPVYEQVLEVYGKVKELIAHKVIVSAYALDAYGIAAGISKTAFGNGLGVKLNSELLSSDLFGIETGNLIAEVPEHRISEIGIPFQMIGTITEEPVLNYGDAEVSLKEAVAAWQKPLEKVFPTDSNVEKEDLSISLYQAKNIYRTKNKIAKPRVFIPVFPGTNCEYDSARAFEAAGANVTTRIFRNLTADDIRDSVEAFKKAISESQILMFPGGFSGGDEPDGSAKFFAAVFRNEMLKEEVNRLLKERDGLVLGICNGFQALIKLGLVPYGEITEPKEDAPTLTSNHIGRHISKMVYTKPVSNKSPWLSLAKPGEVYVNPASHGEGRFVAGKEWIKRLFEEGQVATQYTDFGGNPTMNEEWNPNGSYCAIEGITSPDGRIFGKMAHSERRGEGVAKNITGNQHMPVFESGVAYFRD